MSEPYRSQAALPGPGAEDAKARFLAHVSHEIRTPLNGLLGLADLLADTPLTLEQCSYLDGLRESGDTLLALIEDLLDFSALNAQKLELDWQMHDVRRLATGVVELLAPRAHEKGIGMGLHVGRHVPTEIETDAKRLRQILNNLIGNAVKVTQRGGVALHVDGDAEALAFRVEDSGPGLPEGAAERIFQEFETAGRHGAGGAGLGLAISERLAGALGGRLDAGNRRRGGASFTLHLPLRATATLQNSLPREIGRMRVAVEGLAGPELDALRATIADLGGRWYPFVEDADVVLDARSGHPAPRRPQVRSIALLTPKQRGTLGQVLARGHDGYLIRPIRAHSLSRVIRGDFVAAAPSGEALKTAMPSRGQRILVAEDNPINALLAEATLKRAGYDVLIAQDGQSALDALQSERFDAALLDRHMPFHDADALIRLRRQHEDETGLPPLPMIVVTADGRVEVADALYGVGANAVVTKPVDPGHLVATLEGELTADLANKRRTA